MTTTGRNAIVVGGGIAGCLTAYLLAKEGLSVTILEADSVGSHASGFAFGELGPLHGAGIPHPLLDFSVWCMQQHPRISQELLEVTGIDTQFRRRDRLRLAFDAAEEAYLRHELEWQRQVPGFQVEWVAPEQAVSIEPLANPECRGAIYFQGTGAVEAYRYTLATAQAGEKYGVDMLHRRVDGLLRRGQRCAGVTFPNGQLEADLVIIAMGPWSGNAAWTGFSLPVRPLKGQIIRLERAGDPLQVSLELGGSYTASKPDGLIWAGTTEEEAGFDEGRTTAARDKVMADLLQMAPALSDAKLVQQTACLRPLSSDYLPLVGSMPGWDNLYVVTGGGRKGILWSLGMAQGLADLVLRGDSSVPGLRHLGPDRFTQD